MSFLEARVEMIVDGIGVKIGKRSGGRYDDTKKRPG